MPCKSSRGITFVQPISLFNFLIGVVIAALGFVFQTVPVQDSFAQTPPPCSLERGTVNSDNSFTAGTATTDVDLRIRCTGDLSSVQRPNEVHGEFLTNITGLTEQQVQNLLDILDAQHSVVLIDLSAAHSQYTSIDLRIAPNVIPAIYKVISLGSQTLPSTSTYPAQGTGVSTNTANPYFLRFDNYSTIVNERTSSSSHGMQISTSGGIEMRNYSNITIKGSSSYGIYLRSSGGSGDIFGLNEQGATIRTEGATASLGIYARNQGSGDIRIVNRGNIITTGSRNARGIQIQADEGGASEIINEGSVQTAGVNAHGLVAYTQTDTADNAVVPGAVARVHNKTAGEITTTGNGSFGIRVEHDTTDDPAASDENWLAEAVNEGTITLSGDALDTTTAFNRTYGILAVAFGITNKALVINTGTVTASGNKSIGLEAFTQGNGLAEVRLIGGTVTAGSTGKFGTGIRGVSQTQQVLDESNTDIDVDILVSGQSTEIIAHGGTDDSRTPTDESKAVGIQAFSGGTKTDDSPSTGHSRVRILNGATVNADGGLAVQFGSGRGTLEIESSEIETSTFRSENQRATTRVIGNIDFANGSYDDAFTLTRSAVTGMVNFNGGNDSLTFRNWGIITGDIDFGDGDDTFVMNVSDANSRVNGTIRNVETLRKQGAGVMHLKHIDTDGSMHIEQGNLVISGSVNMRQGTVTIHDASRLTFEVGDVLSDQQDHGSITAANLHFEGEHAEVYVQFQNELSDEKLAEIREALGLPEEAPTIVLLNVETVMHKNRKISSSLPIHSENSESVVQQVGVVSLDDGIAAFYSNKVDQIGMTPQSNLDLAEINRIVSAKSRSNSGNGNSRHKIGLGILAILLGISAAQNVAEVEQVSDFQKLSKQSVRGSSIRKAYIDNDSPSFGLWIQTNSPDDPAQLLKTTIRTDVLGWAVKQHSGYYVRGLLEPNVKLTSTSSDVSAQGFLFSLGSGFTNHNSFVDMSASYGEFDATSGFKSQSAGSLLSGQSDMTTSQVVLSAGSEFDFPIVKFTPTLSFLKGVYRQRAYVADNKNLVATMPDYRQDYSSRIFDFSFRSPDWLELSNGSRMNLSANLSTVTTRSTNTPNLSISMSDKLGVLSFSEPAHSGLVPRSTNIFRFGTTVQPFGKSNQRFWLNYFNMEFDGNREHALVAGTEFRF